MISAFVLSLRQVSQIFFTTIVLKMVYYRFVLSAEIVDDLFHRVEANSGLEISIDLETQTVSCQGEKISTFEIDAFRKHCMLNGLDDIALTLQYADEIKNYGRKKEASSAMVIYIGLLK